ncbi:MAG: hypothetical protein IPH84_11180 [Bacteroidales bacterium]|nr:hypothetical protein [Bacteroidales bacterium]
MNEINQNSGSTGSNLEGLLEKLRNMESESLRELRRWKIIISILGIIIILSVILDPNLVMIIEGICLSGLFILYTYTIRRIRLKPFDLSVKELLQYKLKESRFIQPLTILAALFAAPLIYIGISILITRYLNLNIQGCTMFCLTNIIFAVFFVLVLLLAYFVWYRKNKPVILSIKQCLEELSGV